MDLDSSSSDSEINLNTLSLSSDDDDEESEKNNVEKLPCEFCEELVSIEKLINHQVTIIKSVNFFFFLNKLSASSKKL